MIFWISIFSKKRNENANNNKQKKNIYFRKGIPTRIWPRSYVSLLRIENQGYVVLCVTKKWSPSKWSVPPFLISLPLFFIIILLFFKSRWFREVTNLWLLLLVIIWWFREVTNLWLLLLVIIWWFREITNLWLLLLVIIFFYFFIMNLHSSTVIIFIFNFIFMKWRTWVILSSFTIFYFLFLF